MQRLSRPIGDLQPHYDVVVVGSGYGGGVAASRLARCGRKVCVLERGKEFLPGEFPDRLIEAQPEFQITELGVHVGRRDGLYDLRLGNDMHVFVGCGLGGTSLVNANVSLPPDPRVFAGPAWPEDIAADASWQQGIDRARGMLRPQPYPAGRKLQKLSALEKSGAALGQAAVRPPINVNFQQGTNPAGVVQPACTDCGDCCSGCNVGAKNTVQLTYLADAFQHGAAIFTQAEVRFLRRTAGRWSILFDLIGHHRELFDVPQQEVTADIVVLAAGTLGSTEILLRSQANGLALSQRLGEGFTGNGDVLAFGFDNDVPVNGIGVGQPPQAETGPVGPCITGLIDLRATPDFKDGMVIEEGSLPSPLAPLLPALFVSGGAVLGQDTDRGIEDEAGEAARRLQSLAGGAYEGAVNRTQTYLVMGHDDGRGRMRLVNDKLAIEWPDVARQPVFAAIEARLKAATAATGGTYIRNPLQDTLLGRNLITVHPLGGCTIGRSSGEGVVNHKGQVFDASNAAATQAVHEGLYVCDGSVIPSPLGVNPLLTITGLAERAMIHLARERNWQFDDAPKAGATPLFAAPDGQQNQPAGVEFTERMAGFISRGSADYETGARDGRAANSSLSFTATIVIADIDAFVKDEAHSGVITGTAACPALSPDPLTVTHGAFNLMVRDEAAVRTRRFDYKMRLTARDGRTFWLEGHKVVRSDRGLDLWDDTTRLYVDLWDGDGPQGTPAARGVLTIALADFLTQMRTIRGTGGKNAADRLAAVAKFGVVFAGSLYDIYGGVFAPNQRFDPAAARKKRDLRVGAPEVHPFVTKDGKLLRLTRYKGGEKGPVILSHGLGVSSLIFSLDTIETNLLEYLYAAGYDCWLLDYRASVDLDHSAEQWTADDVATYDYPAAVAKVRELTGRPTVQMLVHCFGSTTFFMAMLSGLQGVRSAVVSQIAADVIVPWWPQRLLAHLRAPALFDLVGIDVVNASALATDGLGSRVVDAALWPVLRLTGRQPIQSATSNRITALYGQLYNYAQLNQATLDHTLPLMFGKANITAFRQLARIARAQHIVGHDGSERYLPHLDRLKLPMCIIHGADNACFAPESTARTHDRLVRAHGASLYKRHVIPGYGHIDCIFGKNAAKDVYPIALQHLEETALA
jgi:cholesterol oxidase